MKTKLETALGVERRMTMKTVELTQAEIESQEYTIVRNQDHYEAAMQLARGCYQRGLLSGQYRLSGAGLRGRMKANSSSYWRSRRALLSRLDQAGIPVAEGTGVHGRKVLVIG